SGQTVPSGDRQICRGGGKCSPPISERQCAVVVGKLKGGSKHVFKISRWTIFPRRHPSGRVPRVGKFNGASKNGFNSQDGPYFHGGIPLEGWLKWANSRAAQVGKHLKISGASRTGRSYQRVT